MNPQTLIGLVDAFAPGLHWLAVGLTVGVLPVLLWLIKIRFDLRKDHRETRENVAQMLKLLVEQQRAELTRLV